MQTISKIIANAGLKRFVGALCIVSLRSCSALRRAAPESSQLIRDGISFKQVQRALMGAVRKSVQISRPMVKLQMLTRVWTEL